jgi:predicted GNAT family N-acyltransferase
MLPPDYTLTETDWIRDQTDLSAVRREVFMDEQAVPVADEWDGLDEQAVHFLVRTSSGEPVATARILREPGAYHIGRLAVRKPYRGRGLGRTLMQYLLDWCTNDKTPIERVYLNAQVSASDFYRRLGFEARGELFMDAGIPHQRMDYFLVQLSLESPEAIPADPDYQLLTRCDEFRDQALLLCQDARRQILILSEHLDAAIYDNAALAEAFASLVRNHRQARVRILVTNINPLLERGHQLLYLARRLPSSVEIRKASPEAESQGQHFVLCDLDEVLYQQPGSDYRGHVRRHAPAEVKSLRELFDRDWNHADADPRLRRLHL